MSDEPHAKHIPDLGDLSDRTLGDFRLLRRLGVGGMAEVYLAEQISLKRSVAVKILRASAVSSTRDTLLRRFEQEARAAGGLSHPNIVQVFMIGTEDDLHFIVQEYVQGQNLNQWVKRNGPPEFHVGLRWMQHVASALKAASDAGIVHRDIKPENIMLTRSNEAKVTDFGLAQLNDTREAQMNLTQAGTTMGTPWYMSPEQIQGEPLDHRTDQYSFGVTCYHMFAGQPPFPGRNSMTVAAQHLKEQPRRLEEFRRDLPPVLCDVIHRMMEKRPEHRFATPDEVERVLADLNHAPVNRSLGQTGSLSDWFRESLPTMRQLTVMLLVCLLVGFVVGRRVLRAPRLIAESAEIAFPRENTPQRQFAAAILQPGNTAAWQAVVQHYPRSDEAYWALLQLGVCHLEAPTADYVAAEKAFSDLIRKTAIDGDERRELRFLAHLGRVCATERLRGTTASENIIWNQLATGYDDLLNAENLVAPSVLDETRSVVLRELSENRQR